MNVLSNMLTILRKMSQFKHCKDLFTFLDMMLPLIRIKDIILYRSNKFLIKDYHMHAEIESCCKLLLIFYHITDYLIK